MRNPTNNLSIEEETLPTEKLISGNRVDLELLNLWMVDSLFCWSTITQLADLLLLRCCCCLWCCCCASIVIYVVASTVVVVLLLLLLRYHYCSVAALLLLLLLLLMLLIVGRGGLGEGIIHREVSRELLW